MNVKKKEGVESPVLTENTLRKLKIHFVQFAVRCFELPQKFNFRSDQKLENQEVWSESENGEREESR